MEFALILIAHKSRSLSHQLAQFVQISGLGMASDVRDIVALERKVQRWKPHVVVLDIRHTDNGFQDFF